MSDVVFLLKKALVSAWKEACASTNASKVVVPAGTYVLNEVVLGGPCKGSIELQVDGTLKAPADPAQMKTDGWVTFQNVDQFTLSGGGTFDGQGKTAWTKNDCSKKMDCKNLPIVSLFQSSFYIVNCGIIAPLIENFKEWYINFCSRIICQVFICSSC